MPIPFDQFLTDEQIAIQELANEFAAKEIRPAAIKLDHMHDPAEAFYMPTLGKKFHEVGLHAMSIPEQYGGGGIDDLFTHCLVGEELGWGDRAVVGCLLSMQMVIYAYVGVEMIGIAAGEAENPQTTIPMAINSFVWRIIIFYVGALFVILAIFPWNRIGVDGSPFVQVFQRMGLDKAAGVINFVVVTAALSSCNGGIFSSGRILHTMAKAGQAPTWFGYIAPNGIPVRAMLVTTAFLFLGAGLNYFTPKEAFEYLTAAVTFIGILVVGFWYAWKKGALEWD